MVSVSACRNDDGEGMWAENCKQDRRKMDERIKNLEDYHPNFNFVLEFDTSRRSNLALRAKTLALPRRRQPGTLAGDPFLCVVLPRRAETNAPQAGQKRGRSTKSPST